MKIIIKIAQAELRTLFSSPIAWVVLVTFFVTSGMQFVEPLERMARMQEVDITNNPQWLGFTGPLTENMFLNSLQRMGSYLYLFIPLLTMGAISREISTGSMALLSSSPVTTKEIVIGKFMGLLLLNLVLLAAIALLLFTGYLCIENAELPWLFSMWLGFFLLANAYMAIGLFISCVTNFQIMAGIATFVVFFLLSEMGGFLQQYDFVRDITWFLSLKGRIDFFKSGLITTRDCIYFILIIILFISLSIIQLNTRYAYSKWTAHFYRYATLIAVIILLGYLSGRPGYVGYWDVTRDQRNTLDSASQNVLKELDGSALTVTLYTNLTDPQGKYGFPEARNKYIWGFWEKYYRFYPNIRLKYDYYYNRTKEDSASFSVYYGNRTLKEIAEKTARYQKVSMNLFKTPEEMDRLIDLSDENYKLVMKLTYKDKQSFLRTYTPPSVWPHPYNVSGAIRELARPEVPKVSFITGHQERSPFRNGDREFGNHTNNKKERKALINLGVKVDTITLQHGEISTATDLLVVADPKSDLHKDEHEKINEYLQAGGNAFFLTEPGKQELLNPIFKELGVRMEDGILVLPRKHVETHAFTGIMTKQGNSMSQEPAMQVNQQLGRGGAAANFIGTGVLSYQDTNYYKIEPIITIPGNNNMWLERGIYVADSAAPIFQPEGGDIKKAEYILAVKLTRTINNKEQRIVIAADADFMSKSGKNGGTIGLGLYSWLLNNEYPVYTKVKIPKDIRLTIGKQAGIRIWHIYVYVIPGVLLALGSIIIIRRMRR